MERVFLSNCYLLYFQAYAGDHVSAAGEIALVETYQDIQVHCSCHNTLFSLKVLEEFREIILRKGMLYGEYCNF